MTETPTARLVSFTRSRLDRGPRPKARGLYHHVAAYVAAIAGAVLITFAWLRTPWQVGLATTVYAVAVVALFGISAAYHRGPWRSERAVRAWKIADHSTISIFIAATYTPVAVLTLNPRNASWLLGIVWLAALGSVVLTFVNHPRWLDVVVYLVLGWAIVPLLPALLKNAGPAIVSLLAAGGLIYSLGAVVYALRWPGRQARLIGYHEHFHAATIIAATLHMIAIWMLVARI
ncbi:putative membrane protein, hemolysin III [Corynebacterium mustelae]|uniref:Putative membrane protein, hemolysin III n=1 Tax=Corynebacterium mustelae TaxID=571915 RepID=A0A0G3H2A8_9CORY|nr:hemolysin III family protein [Corynebacterium mustelae]AKK06890.1 putative membrane protein, hemolysin III [Corynebacterium mustelae]